MSLIPSTTNHSPTPCVLNQSESKPMHSQNNPPQSPSHRYFAQAQGCVHIQIVGGTANPTGASTPGSYSDSHNKQSTTKPLHYALDVVNQHRVGVYREPTTLQHCSCRFQTAVSCFCSQHTHIHILNITYGYLCLSQHTHIHQPPSAVRTRTIYTVTASLGATRSRASTTPCQLINRPDSIKLCSASSTAP
jgi:hypothetical protein